MRTSPLTRARVITAASLVTATLAAGGITSVLATTAKPAPASGSRPAPRVSDDTTTQDQTQGQTQGQPSFRPVRRPQRGNGSPPTSATRGS